MKRISRPVEIIFSEEEAADLSDFLKDVWLELPLHDDLRHWGARRPSIVRGRDLSAKLIKLLDLGEEKNA